jgi:hypothetical protein
MLSGAAPFQDFAQFIDEELQRVGVLKTSASSEPSPTMRDDKDRVPLK